jgi:hypothetical protein
VTWLTLPGLQFRRQKLRDLQQGLVPAVPCCAGQAGVHQLLQPLQAARLALLGRAALQQHQSCNMASSRLYCPCIQLAHRLLLLLLLSWSLAALRSICRLLVLLVVFVSAAPHLPATCWHCCWLSSLGGSCHLLLLLWWPSDAWQ